MFNKLETTFTDSSYISVDVYAGALSWWKSIPLVSEKIGSVVVGSGSGDSVTFLQSSKAGHHLTSRHHCLNSLGNQKTLMFPRLWFVCHLWLEVMEPVSSMLTNRQIEETVRIRLKNDIFICCAESVSDQVQGALGPSERTCTLYFTWMECPASILHKSTSDRHRPVSYPDGPMTARYRFT